MPFNMARVVYSFRINLLSNSLTKLCLEGFSLYDLKNRAVVHAPVSSPRQRKAKDACVAWGSRFWRNLKAKLSKATQSKAKLS